MPARAPSRCHGGLMMRRVLLGVTAIGLTLGGGSTPVSTQGQPLGFFVTSQAGDGANLGGLAGADAHCQKLATAVDAGGRTWRAYLSTTAAGGKPAVNARDRIGKGPWFNAKGERSPQRGQPAHERDRTTSAGKNAERARRNDRRTRGVAEPARHPHRLGPMDVCNPAPETPPAATGPAMRRTVVPWWAIPTGRAAAQRLVECCSSLARLQPGKPARHRRRGRVLLLRRQVASASG